MYITFYIKKYAQSQIGGVVNNLAYSKNKLVSLDEIGTFYLFLLYLIILFIRHATQK